MSRYFILSGIALAAGGAALPGAWGPIAGSAVLGAGWMLLGCELYMG
jgi:hypothetical protein